ncbi:MAG: 1-acyl-sn-glycerol-3-phosphate acyltransferase [Oscillospiraceae bacterium]|nr:1-acyl-sn-glycerol-3-phosphate acyltransferase [Oscillospiraceae bacterium]
MNRLLLMVLRNFWRVPGAYAKLCHYAKHTDEYPEKEKYDHIRYIMQLAVNSGNLDLQVYGQENIPQENGFIMYGNHQGLFDVVAIVASFDKILAAVFKKELADVPFLRQIIACTKSFAMDRENVRQSLEVIQKVTKEVQAGRNYLIFPEGTRSKNGNQMGEFHGGSFRCAVKAKCPILPIVFIDSYKVLDQKGSKPIAVQLHYLKPIPYEEYKDLKTVDIAAMVKDRIQAVIDEYAPHE